MPVLHKRINKDTFGDVIARVNSRLAGWRGRFLSLAGRVTLTKAVLSSLPVHTMTTISLPQSTLDALDRISRDFVWGSSPEKKKQHLIAWDRVCQPKGNGGLGIRLSKQMNKSLLAKLGWRLLHDRNSLWSQILRCKYKVGDIRDLTWLVPKSTWSSTWRSIGVGLREVIAPGLSWVIGDGKDCRFWKDKWLCSVSLSDLAVTNIPEPHCDVKVRDLWFNGLGWNLQMIMPYVSDQLRLRLTARVVDTVTGSRDRLSWGECSDGKFTVKSAYSFLTRQHEPKQRMDRFYGSIWKMVAPERIRVFFWLVGNQALMTNMERFRRHLSSSGVCQVCNGAEETTIHILRDCPATAGVWRRIVPRRKIQKFFAASLLEWIYGNLGDTEEIRGCSWATLFAMTAWWGWKWRCGNIFGSNGKCRDRVRFVVEKAMEVSTSHTAQQRATDRVARVERWIAWTTPSEGWHKVNTDGASHGNPGLATADGVVRDNEGNWCGGFAVNIRICSAPLAELWGVYYGLYIAWDRGVRRLELEVDSEIVVGFLQTGIEDSHPMSFLVRLCYGFISKDWIVRISHVYREANRLADGLANYAFTLPLGFHMFNVCPDSVRTLVLEDANGSAHPRNVRL